MNFYGNKLAIKQLHYNMLAPLDGYLLKGPKGLGKFTLANQFVRGVLCLEDKKADCTCDSCKKYRLNAHPDLFIITPEGSSIKKEQIQYCISQTASAPIVGKYKVFIIDDANLMTPSSQNSLLKVLEEGHGYNIFIFVAHADLLPTVESRVVHIPFVPLADHEVWMYLNTLSLDLFAKQILLATSQGSIGTIKNIMSHDTFDRFVQILDTLYSIQRDKPKNTLLLFNQLKEKDKNSFYEVYNDFIYEFLCFLKTFYIDMIMVKLGSSSHIHVNCKKEEYTRLSAGYSTKELYHLLEFLDSAIILAQRNKLDKNYFFDVIRKIAS